MDFGQLKCIMRDALCSGYLIVLASESGFQLFVLWLHRMYALMRYGAEVM